MRTAHKFRSTGSLALQDCAFLPPHQSLPRPETRRSARPERDLNDNLLAITGGGREGEEQRKLHETARRADGRPGGGGGPPSTTTLAPTSTRPNGRCLEREEPSHRPRRRQHGMAWQLPACGRRREARSPFKSVLSSPHTRSAHQSLPRPPGDQKRKVRET